MFLHKKELHGYCNNCYFWRYHFIIRHVPKPQQRSAGQRQRGAQQQAPLKLQHVKDAHAGGEADHDLRAGWVQSGRQQTAAARRRVPVEWRGRRRMTGDEAPRHGWSEKMTRAGLDAVLRLVL